MAKTTRQRFTHSASSGLPNNSYLIFEKLVIYMLTTQICAKFAMLYVGIVFLVSCNLLYVGIVFLVTNNLLYV